MKKAFILLFVALTCHNVCSQVYVGLRDTKYAYAGYQWDSNWHVQLNHSVFIEHLKHQYVSGQGAMFISGRRIVAVSTTLVSMSADFMAL